MNGIKVLIVEDERISQKFFLRVLGSKVLLLQAASVREAERFFVAHPDIKAIALDGCLVPGSEELTTLCLAKKFRRDFNGSMIAMSSNPLYPRQLIEAGCDYEIDDKRILPRKLSEILGI